MQVAIYRKIELCLTILEIYDLDDLTQARIKKQCRILQLKYHPDSGGPEYKNGMKFIEMMDAYNWLADPEHLALLPEYCQIHRTTETAKETTAAKETSNHNQNNYRTYTTTRKRRTPYPAEEVDGRLYDLEKCIWEPVDSSNLRFVYYDTYRKYLFVIFKSSQARVYCYKGVEFETYDAFMNSVSLGSFLNNRIKPYYKCVRMAAIISEEDLNTYKTPLLLS